LALFFLSNLVPSLDFPHLDVRLIRLLKFEHL